MEPGLQSSVILSFLGFFLKILETEDIEEGASDSSSFSEQSLLVEDITAATTSPVKPFFLLLP